MKLQILQIILAVILISYLSSCNKDESEESNGSNNSATNEWETLEVSESSGLGDGYKGIGLGNEIYFFASTSNAYNNDSIFLTREFFKIGLNNEQESILSRGCLGQSNYPSFGKFVYSTSDFLFAVQQFNEGFQFCRYSLDNDEWITLDPVLAPEGTEPFFASAISYLNGKIYLLESQVDAEDNLIYSFYRAPVSGSLGWETLPEPLFNLGNGNHLLGFDNKLYLFSQGGDISNQVTVFDLISNEWSFWGEIPIEVGSIYDITIIDQKAYVLADIDGATSSDFGSIYSYDFINNTWERIADGPTRIFSSTGQNRTEISSFTSTENSLIIIGEIVDYNSLLMTYGPEMFLNIQKLEI